MDRYFGLNKSNKENEFDLDILTRQIDEDLLNYKPDNNLVDHSYRDDLSESESTPSYRRRDVNESFSSSLNVEAFKDLKQAYYERDQMLPAFENTATRMKMALNNQFVDYDHENMTEKQFSLNNKIIAEDKLAEIKQNVQKTIVQVPVNNYLDKDEDEVHFAENNEELANDQELPADEAPSSIRKQKTNNFQSLIDEENSQLARRKEKADQEREASAMEAEDVRSLKYERFLHQQKFKDRLFTLPESIPIYREFTSQLASLQASLPKAKFGMPRISKPISDPKKNLLEASKTEIDKLILNKVVNKKKNRLSFEKINEKDKLLLSKNKFDPGLTKSGTLGLSKNSENTTSRMSLKKTFNQENQPSLINQKTSSDKSRRTSQTSDKNSISKWTLSKFLTINLKLTKIDINEIKTAIRQIGSLPIDKLICSEITTGNKAVDSENDPDLDIDDSKKSFEDFVSKLQHKNPRKLEIKMEELTDIKNIGLLKDLQVLKLPMNKIQEIRELNSLRMLIEVDLSQNGIKSIKGISNLKFLRNLNLEVNLISKIEDLDGCEFLESLNLNNNHITRIEGLKTLKRLKKLLLFRNKITKMDGLEDLQWLEEVDLGRNSIKEIESVHKLPLLRKLVLYFNQIERLPQNFCHISLSEIWLNGNKLGGISELSYFPSLKFLNLQENEISVLTQNSFVFAPNLKSLNLSFNKIESFGQLYKLLLHINSLQQLELNENPFLHGNTETLRAFYDDGLVALLPNLSNLNSKPISHRSIIVKDNINVSLRDSLSLYPGRLESNIHHVDKVTSNKLNRYGDAFYIQKHQLSVRTHVGLSYLSKAVETSNVAVQGKPYIMDNKYSYELVMSNYKYRHSLSKIKSLLLKIIYKKRKLRKHFQKNLSKIVKIQAFWRGYKLRKLYNVKKIIRARNEKIHFFSLAKFAVKIQKAFRVFIMKTRLKKIGDIKKKSKFVDSDLSDLEDDDISIPQEPNYDDFTIKIPENLAFHKFVSSTQSKQPAPPQTNPKSVQMTQNVSKNNHHAHKISETPIKVVKNTKQAKNDSDSQSEEEEKSSKHNDSYSVSSIRSGQSLTTIRLKENKAAAPKVNPVLTNERKEQNFKEWGFESEDVKKVYEFRLKKELKRKTNPNLKKK